MSASGMRGSSGILVKHQRGRRAAPMLHGPCPFGMASAYAAWPVLCPCCRPMPMQHGPCACRMAHAHAAWRVPTSHGPCSRACLPMKHGQRTASAYCRRRQIRTRPHEVSKTGLGWGMRCAVAGLTQIPMRT
eukprot:95121-Chlamydomonas_euryale.AAC.2